MLLSVIWTIGNGNCFLKNKSPKTRPYSQATSHNPLAHHQILELLHGLRPSLCHPAPLLICLHLTRYKLWTTPTVRFGRLKLEAKNAAWFWYATRELTHLSVPSFWRTMFSMRKMASKVEQLKDLPPSFTALKYRNPDREIKLDGDKLRNWATSSHIMKPQHSKLIHLNVKATSLYIKGSSCQDARCSRF